MQTPASIPAAPRRQNRILIPLFLLAACALPVELQAQDPPAQTAASIPAFLPTDPTELMVLATRTNGLTGAGIQPWHLKVSYKSTDEQGKVTEGTIEELWAAPGQSKLTYSAPGFQQTNYTTPEKQFRTGDKASAPAALTEVQNLFVNPLPSAAYLQRLTLISKPLDANGLKFTCIGLDPSKPGTEFGPLAGRTICLSADKPIVRAVLHNQGRDQYLFNRIILFQGHTLPGDIRLTHSGKEVLTAHLETLELLKSINDADFTPPPDAVPVARKVVLSGAVAQGNLLKRFTPIYPEDAKAARVAGTVVLQATIRTDGQVSDLKVVSGPPILQQAALYSVKTWVYKHYLLNGEAVEVDTTINVVFDLRR